MEFSIAPALPADLTLIVFGNGREISSESLCYRHKVSPYVGKLLRAHVRRTWLRGQQIYGEGLATDPGPRGRMVKPQQRE